MGGKADLDVVDVVVAQRFRREKNVFVAQEGGADVVQLREEALRHLLELHSVLWRHAVPHLHAWRCVRKLRARSTSNSGGLMCVEKGAEAQANLWRAEVQVVDAVQVDVLYVPAEERLHGRR